MLNRSFDKYFAAYFGLHYMGYDTKHNDNWSNIESFVSLDDINVGDVLLHPQDGAFKVLVVDEGDYHNGNTLFVTVVELGGSNAKYTFDDNYLGQCCKGYEIQFN